MQHNYVCRCSRGVRRKDEREIEGDISISAEEIKEEQREGEEGDLYTTREYQVFNTCQKTIVNE